MLSLDPINPFVIENIGNCYSLKGLYEQGVAEVKRALSLGARSTPNALADLPYVLTRAGKFEEARQAVKEIQEIYEKRGTGAYSLARGYAAIGEKDKALEWLERAYDEHSPSVEWAAVELNFEVLYSDPRFIKFLEKIGVRGTKAQ